MSGKILYVLIAALILAGAGFYLYDARYASEVAPSNEANSEQTARIIESNSESSPADSSSDANAPVNKLTPSDQKSSDVNNADEELHYSDESDIDGNDILVHEVGVSGALYAPTSLTVKTGDIVVFKNTGNTDFRIKSDTYPNLDSVDPQPAGELFQFKFVKVGTWKYYNAMAKSNATGTIIVTK